MSLKTRIYDDFSGRYVISCIEMEAGLEGSTSEMDLLVPYILLHTIPGFQFNEALHDLPIVVHADAPFLSSLISCFLLGGV